jgi:hypothetical protein
MLCEAGLSEMVKSAEAEFTVAVRATDLEMFPLVATIVTV